MAAEQGLRILLSHVYCWPEHQRGAERYLHDLADQLARNGHRVDVVSSASQARSETQGAVELNVVRQRAWRQSRYGELSGAVAFGWQSLAFAARHHYDVWHATSISDAAAATRLARVRPGLRTVFTDHGFPAQRSRDRREDRAQFGRVWRDIDEYVCVSAPAAELLRSDYGREAVVVPPGVDTDRFVLGEEREPHPTVLYSGSLTERRKNVSLLLDSADLLLDKWPDAQIWLLGQGDAGPILDAATARVRAATTKVGPVNSADLIARYQRAWVTALPSTAEAFGMALVESLSCGTPGVGLNDGLGPATILTPSTGTLSPETPQGLADAIDEAFELASAPETRAACRSRAEEFDWRSVVVPALEALYRQPT